MEWQRVSGKKEKRKKHVNAVVLFYLFGVSFLIIVFKRMAFFVKQKSSNYMKNWHIYFDAHLETRFCEMMNLVIDASANSHKNSFFQLISFS